jgi:hypothetical protein
LAMLMFLGLVVTNLSRLRQPWTADTVAQPG